MAEAGRNYPPRKDVLDRQRIMAERQRKDDISTLPPSTAGASVYAIIESEEWITSAYAGAGYDWPLLGTTVDNITSQSGGFSIVDESGIQSIGLPTPGFYHFIWHWTFDYIAEGYTKHGAIEDPYWWEIQTRLPTGAGRVLQSAVEFQAQIYSSADGSEFQGSMNGIVEATSDRLLMSLHMHRYAMYQRDWFAGDGTDFYSFDALEAGVQNIAIEKIA